MMERAGVALLVIGLQALEAFLFIRGLRLPERWSLAVLICFGAFNLPLPYVFWLQAGARQPPFLAAAFVVRPFFAWHFSWLCFLLFLGPAIVLANGGAWLFGSEVVVTILRWVALGIGALWGAVCVIGLYNITRPPQVINLELNVSGLSREDDGIRVVHMSDPHVAWWNSKEEICRISKIIAELEPDIFVITGDMVDHHANYVHALADCLEEVRPRLGRYAIIGNHDVYTGRRAVARRMEARGFKMLRDECISLAPRGAHLALAGIDDEGKRWTGRDSSDEKIPGIVGACPRDLPVILLAHRPTAFEQVKGLPVPLTLTGHTHGGQLKLPFGGPGLADITYEHPSGLHRRHDQMLYVSRGTGTVGWPFRFSCPGEVTLITLRSPH